MITIENNQVIKLSSFIKEFKTLALEFLKTGLEK